jgi:hypothetical protein
MWRLISTAISFSFAVMCALQQPVAVDNPPNLRVTIIAVTQFEDPNLKGDKELNDANTEAAKDLKTYFESNFKVRVDLYSVAQETSEEFLRNWLFNDLRHDSRKGVHLVFVLTHGFADLFGANANKSEIFLATSDTYKDHIPGKAIRGGDFIDAFQNMPPKATVFLFLDTCGSGAIDNENLRKLLQSDPEFASRVMILAAANSDELAYGARFTKTLLNIWQSKTPAFHCGPMHIERYLTDSLKVVPGVSPDVRQTVRVVAPLSPDFCIENFNYTQRFLMLYNAAPGDISVTLQASDQPDPDTTIPLKKNQMVPISQLRPINYQMVAKRKLTDDQADETSNLVENIDLTSVPAKIVVLFSDDPLDKAEASQAAAHYLDSREILGPLSAALERSSTEIASRVSNQLTDQFQQIQKQDSSLRASIPDVEINLQRTKYLADLAKQEHEKALGRLNQSHPLGIDGSLRSEVERTSKRRIEAQSEYQRFEEEALLLDQKLLEMRNAQSAELLQLDRAKELMKSANDFAAKRIQEIALVTSASKELQTVLPDVQLNDRGIFVTLTGISPERTTDSGPLRRFVDISNKYPSLNLEVELLQSGENTIKNQVTVRARAAALLQGLRRLGLRSENAVARGFITPGRHPLTIDLILSQP